jgi:glycosyltransferase involved in cell wall biosynthesis
MDRYLLGLAGGLARRGVDVTLFHRTREPLNPSHLEGLTADVLGVADASGLYWEQVAVPWAILRGGYDLYHAPAERGVPLLSPRPVVFTIHSVTWHSYVNLVESGALEGRVEDYLGFPANPYRWDFPNLYWRSQVARASHILVPSQFTKDEVVQFLGVVPERVTVTPLSVPQLFTAPAAPPAERQRTLERLGVGLPYLLYVGGFEPHKNVRGLLRAFAAVRRSRRDLMLVAVGSKALPLELGQLAVDAGLRPGTDVQFLVNLSAELVDLYDEAELFVSLSWRESFGLPALEAARRGCPVVASAWGAASEVIGEAGVLVDPRDEEAAARKIVALLEAPDREARRSCAREVAARFSWDRTAETTLAVYERLLARRREGAP